MHTGVPRTGNPLEKMALLSCFVSLALKILNIAEEKTIISTGILKTQQTFHNPTKFKNRLKKVKTMWFKFNVLKLIFNNY